MSGAHPLSPAYSLLLIIDELARLLCCYSHKPNPLFSTWRGMYIVEFNLLPLSLVVYIMSRSHLLHIQFYQLYWRILIRLHTDIVLTYPSLYVISGRAGELFSEIWRIFEWTTYTAGSTAITISERIIWKEASFFSWIFSWFTEIVSTHGHKWWDGNIASHHHE